MPSVEVRSATPEDIPQLVDAYQWLFAPPGTTPQDWDPKTATDRIARTIEGQGSNLLVAVDGDEVVGFCSMYLDLVSIRFGQRCWVEDLAVDPGRRSAGSGAALLKAAWQWAAANGASHLELDSGMARVDAHRFYDRHQPATHSITFGWNKAPQQ
ncbi:GNAT family N-acetyltransferase [Kribbella sp. NPDC006257]|uniref:GNAT family N-acetyltransferase n=1 Tax=Kribbella sp. NPDC006257 TaxID=3156738 RepID=UPI0033A43651